MAVPSSFKPGKRGHFLPNPKLKFLDQCREVMRFKQLSHRTEETYVQWIRRYILFHRGKAEIQKAESRNEAAGQQHRTSNTEHPTSNEGGLGGAHGVARPTQWVWRHPKDMGEAEVRGFLTDLAVTRRVGAATQNQALNAV